MDDLEADTPRRTTHREMSDIEKQEYDRRWVESGYGAEQLGYTPSFLKFMRRHLGRHVRPGSSALEVGCGNGWFSSQLIALGYDTTGIDLSPVAVDLARQRYPQGRFLTHDLTEPLPFADHSFDALWCSEVLEHLFSPLQAIAEAQRVLKPGGVALFTTPYHGLIKNLGIALFAFDRHYDPKYPHIRFFTKKTLTGLIRETGLTVDEVSTCGSQLGLRDLIVPTNLLVACHKQGA